jgi:predicted ABC-type ATPase
MIDDRVSEEAMKYIKGHVRDLIKRFADVVDYPPSDKPITIFMAGSPGAGKTEWSKSFIKEFKQKDPSTSIVRIDADDIREMMPQYTGSNSCDVQAAAIKGVEKLFDHVQKHHQNAIVDGTFAHYNISSRDVMRALGRGRSVGIFYIYQDPLLAWSFTKMREALEHRAVSKEVFINDYFAAQENVNKIKAELGSKIELHLIIKDLRNRTKKQYFKIEKLEGYLKTKYNREDLEKNI